MLTRTCEVQIDAASYSWNVIYKPRIYDLKRTLKQKLNNVQLFERYDLFESAQNICENDRYLIGNDKLSLKTKDGTLFYAQSVANESNAELFEQLKHDALKLEEEIDAQIKFRKSEIEFRRHQTVQSENLQKDLKEQMQKECEKINNNMNLSITKKNIESNYKIILTQQCNFDEKKAIIATLNNKYQKLYKKVKREYDRIKDKHFEELKNPNIKQLILLGKTGDGKSAFGNRLCCDKSPLGNKGPFKSTNDPNSVTKKIQKYVTEIGCDKVSVVDTPGDFDSNGATADWEHAQDLVKYLKGCGGINAFVVICKPPRLDGTFLQMLKNLTIMLGREFWEYVIFVVTHLKINCVKMPNNKDVIEEKKEEESESESESESDDDHNYGHKSPQEWLTEFALIVRGKFDLPANQPMCIGAENMNYNSYNLAITKLINCMKQDKFECDRIKSPFDEKKRELQAIFDEIQSTLLTTKQMRAMMQIIEREIADQILEVQRHDKNYRPSFRSLNVERMTEMETIDFKDVEMIDKEININENKYDMGYSYVIIEDEKTGDRSYIDYHVAQSCNINAIGSTDGNDSFSRAINTVIKKNGIFSHYITPTTITNDCVEISLFLKEPMSKTTTFYIYECGQEDGAEHVAQFTMRKGMVKDIEELELDVINDISSFSIALYGIHQNDGHKIPISNQLHIAVPDEIKVNENYEPNPITLSSVNAVEDDENVYIYINTPPQLFGDEIVFKMRYIDDDNKDDDYIVNPLVIQKSTSWPISFQIITSSTIDDEEYLSKPSDIITIGYFDSYAILSNNMKQKPEKKEEDELFNYLKGINFAQYIDNFRRNGFATMNVLKMEADGLDQKDLKEMGVVKLVHQKKLLRAIHEINQPSAPAAPQQNDKKDQKEGSIGDTGYLK